MDMYGYTVLHSLVMNIKKTWWSFLRFLFDLSHVERCGGLLSSVALILGIYNWQQSLHQSHHDRMVAYKLSSRYGLLQYISE